MKLAAPAGMQAFRAKPVVLWRLTFPSLLLGAFTAAALRWFAGKPFSWPDTLPLMLIAAVIVVLTYVLQPTLAGAAGLRVLNTWGTRSFLGWGEVVRVDFARLYGLQPSLRLRDQRGRSYWIARESSGLQTLWRLAVQHGGPQHPLALALQTPLYRL
jgi:hypothetical protein